MKHWYIRRTPMLSRVWSQSVYYVLIILQLYQGKCHLNLTNTYNLDLYISVFINTPTKVSTCGSWENIIFTSPSAFLQYVESVAPVNSLPLKVKHKYLLWTIATIYLQEHSVLRVWLLQSPPFIPLPATMTVSSLEAKDRRLGSNSRLLTKEIYAVCRSLDLYEIKENSFGVKGNYFTRINILLQDRAICCVRSL